MMLSINCKDAGGSHLYTHDVWRTEEELFKNAKEHGIQVHGYTEETWNKEISKNKEQFKNLIKRS